MQIVYINDGSLTNRSFCLSSDKSMKDSGGKVIIYVPLNLSLGRRTCSGNLAVENITFKATKE